MAPRPVVTLARLRRHLARVLFPAPQHAGVGDAIAALGFVQADPIRAPARAQDLILRHRVAGYRAGDLEREYPALDLDEDFVYAYGFVPPATRRLLHPRLDAVAPPAALVRRVLAVARERGELHPRDLARELGDRREVNAWGGSSRATTRALEALHHRGLLRVARRESGVRVYAPVPQDAAHAVLPPAERLRALVLMLAGLFGPQPESGLRVLLAHARHAIAGFGTGGGDRRGTIDRLVREGALVRATVDGTAWTWRADAPPADGDAPSVVRFLAPFDPLAWDRARFELLWGWDYRFEAYTPAPKRRFGYYALPLLWRDRVIGWANVARSADGDSGAIDVQTGFASGRRPADRAFGVALDAEIARMERFLTPR